MERKNVLFLSSSFVNMARMFAENNKDCDVFLVLDRKFPFEIEDMDNFYTYIFHKGKMFEKDKEAYFDNLAVFLNDFNPDVIICNNFTKLLTKSFIDFMKFRNPDVLIINLHHADLRVMEKGRMRYVGLNADIQQFLEEEKIVTTIHLIEDEGIDTGEQLSYSHPTTLSELKSRGFLKKKEDIINLRVRNVVLSYHERTKVLRLIRDEIRRKVIL